MAKIKGFAITAPGEVGWIEKEQPPLASRSARIKTIAAAICSSDIHAWEMSKAGPAQLNNFLGHEAIGVITEVGADVKDFKVGDKVLCPSTTPDWDTLECQKDLHQQSGGPSGGFRFLKKQDGSFAEYFDVIQADQNLCHIPEWMSDETALMLTDMTSTGFSGVEMVDLKYGESIAVIGIGPVGLMSVAAARIGGAGRIIAVGSRKVCVDLAKEYGANDVISYRDGDIVEQIKALTDGQGVDKVVITGGGNDVVEQALAMVKWGGIVGNLNYFSDVLNPIKIMPITWGRGMGNKQLRSTLAPGGRLRMERLRDVVRYGNFDPAKLVTHRFYGLDKVEEAFWFMEGKPADMIKPIVIF